MKRSEITVEALVVKGYKVAYKANSNARYNMAQIVSDIQNGGKVVFETNILCNKVNVKVNGATVLFRSATAQEITDEQGKVDAIRYDNAIAKIQARGRGRCKRGH